MAKAAVRAAKVDYAARAVRYAKTIIAGEIPACRLTVLACERFLRDLEKPGQWVYSENLANHACKFIELLPVIDGGADRNIRLADWQCFVVCNLFGWIHRETKERRFYYGTLLIGRGNGKSYLASAIALYMIFGSGQKAAEGYALASAMSQARIVWQTAQQMLMLRENIAKKLGINIGQHSLTDKSGNVFKPLSSESKTQYGLRPAFAVVDELHVVDPDLMTAVQTALGKRKSPLLLVISTAGFERSGLAFDRRDLARRILEGKESSERHFVAIWEADSESDLLDRTEWQKANPNLDVSVSSDVIEEEAREALALPSKRSEFITLRLNRFASPPSGWLPMGKWDACKDTGLRLEDFEGRDCYIGVDLAIRRDLCSKVYVFPEQREDGTHYTVFQKSYLPEAQVAANPKFKGWEYEGHLEVTSGDITDLILFQDELCGDVERFNVKEICFDKAHGDLMMQNLQAKFGPDFIIDVPQRVSGLSEPMKMTEEAILQGRLHHNGDPLLAWCVSNVVQFVSAQGNIFPEKVKKDSPEKIDAAVALITAMKRAPTCQPSTGPLLFKVLGAGADSRAAH